MSDDPQDDEQQVWVCVNDPVVASVHGHCARCQAPIAWSVVAPPGLEKICLQCAEAEGPVQIVILAAVVEEYAAVEHLTIAAAREQMRAIVKARYQVEPIFSGMTDE